MSLGDGPIRRNRVTVMPVTIFTERVLMGAAFVACESEAIRPSRVGPAYAFFAPRGREVGVLITGMPNLDRAALANVAPRLSPKTKVPAMGGPGSRSLDIKARDFTDAYLGGPAWADVPPNAANPLLRGTPAQCGAPA